MYNLYYSTHIHIYGISPPCIRLLNVFSQVSCTRSRPQRPRMRMAFWICVCVQIGLVLFSCGACRAPLGLARCVAPHINKPNISLSPRPTTSRCLFWGAPASPFSVPSPDSRSTNSNRPDTPVITCNDQC